MSKNRAVKCCLQCIWELGYNEHAKHDEKHRSVSKHGLMEEGKRDWKKHEQTFKAVRFCNSLWIVGQLMSSWYPKSFAL